MEDQLISYETAVLAKEKGFNIGIKCNACYSIGGSYLYRKDSYSDLEIKIDENPKRLFNPDIIPNDKKIQACTQSLLQKWVREKYDIHIEIAYWDNNTWSAQLVADIFRNNDELESYEAENCKTYEEALEIGLQAALKLI